MVIEARIKGRVEIWERLIMWFMVVLSNAVSDPTAIASTPTRITSRRDATPATALAGPGRAGPGRERILEALRADLVHDR